MRTGICVALLVAACAPVLTVGDAKAQAPAVRSADRPTLPDPPTPVRQVREIGLDQCAPVLDLMARQTLTHTYDVQSGWSRSDPAHHVFQSVAALTTPGNVPPDGFTALVAAPVAAAGCDGVAMQVFPLASDCQTAQRTMMKSGRLLAPMLNTRIMLDGGGNRVILLPAAKNTCIAISVDTRFGTPSRPSRQRCVYATHLDGEIQLQI